MGVKVLVVYMSMLSWPGQLLMQKFPEMLSYCGWIEAVSTVSTVWASAHEDW